MMSGRERVKAALTFQHPDRPPRDLWALPYISLFRKDELDRLLAEFPPDIGGIQLSPGSTNEDAERYGKAGSYVDEWGSRWYVGEPGVIGEVREPILDDWSKLDSFRPPWELVRNRDFSYANRLAETSQQFILSPVCARPFERMQFLRGSEALYVDIAYGTAEMRRLLEMVHEYNLEDMRGWCSTNVDGAFFMDDWGSNKSLLIRPKTWRELFKPLYRDYATMIHAAGKFAFFHSDGDIHAIYPDLIEIGVDAVNSQLFTMDIEELGRLHRGKITFWGEIDRQHVMPFGTPAEVRAAVQRVRAALDDGSGGVIAQCEWGKDNSFENVHEVFATWAEPQR
jgi:uroporphyrinogen decarboxylase